VTPSEPPLAGDGFSSTFRVRFDEAGPDGLVRTSALLRYTQDLAAQHSEALGYDRAWYAHQGLNWLVRTAAVDIRAAVPYGSGLVGTTRVVGFRRVWSRRETTFELGGTLVAVVRIDWVLLDRRGAPARIPAEFERIFPAQGSGRPLQLGRVALAAPPSEAGRLVLSVRPQELDPLDHVNNAAYADWLEEAVLAATGPDGRRIVGAIPRRVALEYALAAGPGEALDAITWAEAGGWSCRVVRSGDGAELLRARLEPGTAPPEAEVPPLAVQAGSPGARVGPR
jgi:acyl-CoA thioesterase FadM